MEQSGQICVYQLEHQETLVGIKQNRRTIMVDIINNTQMKLYRMFTIRATNGGDNKGSERKNADYYCRWSKNIINWQVIVGDISRYDFKLLILCDGSIDFKCVSVLYDQKDEIKV